MCSRPRTKFTNWYMPGRTRVEKRAAISCSSSVLGSTKRYADGRGRTCSLPCRVECKTGRILELVVDGDRRDTPERVDVIREYLRSRCPGIGKGEPLQVPSRYRANGTRVNEREWRSSQESLTQSSRNTLSRLALDSARGGNCTQWKLAAQASTATQPT